MKWKQIIISITIMLATLPITLAKTGAAYGCPPPSEPLGPGPICQFMQDQPVTANIIIILIIIILLYLLKNRKGGK